MNTLACEPPLRVRVDTVSGMRLTMIDSMPSSLLAQRHRGMHAAEVELDPLADAFRGTWISGVRAARDLLTARGEK